MAIQVVFDNDEHELSRSDCSYAQNTGSQIDVTTSQIADGWSRLASNNLEALKLAAKAIRNSFKTTS